MDDLTKLPITEAVPSLREGEFSCQELTRAYIQRIETNEPSINAFITLTLENAIQQALTADERLIKWRKDRKESLPPLLGIPIAIKDVLATKGIQTTAGSRILENFTPPYSAGAVQRLLDAGMILLGKTNMDEFAMGSSTENSAYGVTRNPWNTQRVPGGSSGGSAAAVAARMSPVALGTDTGGSVRQPAAFCGVTGLKPTYGRVSRSGLIAYGSSYDTVGILSKSAADATALFTQIAGFDPKDSTTAKIPVTEIDLRTNLALKDLRIGIPEEYFGKGLRPEIGDAIKKALKTFEDLGAVLQEIRLPHTQYAVPVYYISAVAEASANLARYDGIRYGPRADAETILETYQRSRGERFGSEVKRRIMLGTYTLSAGYYDAFYGKAEKVRKLIRQDFTQAFDEVDMIAAPVTPTTAFNIGEHEGDPLSMYLEDIYTLPANLAGAPGIAFPIGFDREQMPIGMQLMAPNFQEAALLAAANAYQQETHWHQIFNNDLN